MRKGMNEAFDLDLPDRPSAYLKRKGIDKAFFDNLNLSGGPLTASKTYLPRDPNRLVAAKPPTTDLSLIHI